MMVPQAKHRRKEANPLLRTSSSGSAGSGKSSPALQFADVQLALADFGDVTPSQVALAVQMGSFSVDLSQASLALPGLDVEDRKFVLKLASLMRLHGTLMGIGVDIHVVLTRVHDPELADGGASDDSDSEANIEDESILEADIDIDDAAEVSSIPAPVLLPPAPSNESPLPLPIALANLTLSSVGGNLQCYRAFLPPLKSFLASSSIEPKIARLNAIIDAIKEKAGSGGGKNKKPKELDSQSDDDVLINATIRNYYVDKLHLSENDATEWMKQRDEMCHEFIKGVQWVLAYYYSGVASWSWFYPFQYAIKEKAKCLYYFGALQLRSVPCRYCRLLQEPFLRTTDAPTDVCDRGADVLVFVQSRAAVPSVPPTHGCAATSQHSPHPRGASTSHERVVADPRLLPGQVCV